MQASFAGVRCCGWKNLGLVDPNSTSGNNVPRFILNKLKIVPVTCFAHVNYIGSHENAVIALQQKTVDIAANWWNSDDDSNLTRLGQDGQPPLSTRWRRDIGG